MKDEFQIGWCDEDGIGLSKPFTMAPKLAKLAIQRRNERAKQAALNGITPNTVYWIQEIGRKDA